ncbi:MAG: hypothetical protein KKA32_17985 [Actinobacteria bacterium]|nr:hypothetical protein [Actinomycetota bacterium]
MAERLRKGWRWDPVKDPVKKLNPTLVPWGGSEPASPSSPDGLPENERKKDRDAVRAIPELLSETGSDSSCANVVVLPAT